MACSLALCTPIDVYWRMYFYQSLISYLPQHQNDVQYVNFNYHTTTTTRGLVVYVILCCVNE